MQRDFDFLNSINSDEEFEETVCNHTAFWKQRKKAEK
jgi:hypothetical protein